MAKPVSFLYFERGKLWRVLEKTKEATVNSLIPKLSLFHHFHFLQTPKRLLVIAIFIFKEVRN